MTIDGKDDALDAPMVRRPGEDKPPVALVTHGACPGKPRAANLGWLRGWAHDLAHRGWLAVEVMRRGFALMPICRDLTNEISFDASRSHR